MAQASKTRKVFDNRYEILSIVGRGHCSVVYHARHVMSPTAEVALKVLLSQRDNSSNAERLRREAHALVSARHPHVIRLDDFHSVGDLCYLSMEYAPECDLRKFTAKRGKQLEPLLAERFLLQLCEALAFIHKNGMIHRDIKPDNFLAISEKEVRLGDFGVASMPGMESTLEELQAGVGTMNYMPPEVLSGVGYEQASDIYALGLSFYELLSGIHPFEAAPLMRQLEIREHGKFPSLSSLLPHLRSSLANAIMKAMSYNSAQRFGSAEEMADAIRGRKRRVGRPPVGIPADLPGNDGIIREFNIIPLTPGSAAKEKERTPTSPEAERVLERKRVQEEQPAGQRTDLPDMDQPEKVESKTQDIPMERERSTTSNDLLTGTPHRPPARAKHPRTVHTVDMSARLSRAKTIQIDRNTAQEIRETAQQSAAQSADTVPARIGRKFFITLAIVLAITFVICGGIALKYNHGSSLLRLATPGSTESSEMTTSPDANEALSYPNLPGGVFSGAISGLIPAHDLSLTILSLPSKQKLIFIVGLEGWTPAIVSLDEWREKGGKEDLQKPIRIASNGYLLEMMGQLSNGAIVGTFKNLVTGEEGAWQVAKTDR